MTKRYSSHLNVAPLQEEHLTDAADLFTTRYKAARRADPNLPGCHERAESILPKLRELAEKAPGVAAIREGKLTGFMLGQVMDEFRGRRAVYSPEWAHAAEGNGQREIYRRMYAHLSAHWVADGCFSHLITMLSNDHEAVDAFFWMEFGICAVDTIRDLKCVAGRVGDVEIRRACVDDADVVVGLAHGLDDHMAGAPVFMACLEKTTQEEITSRLTDSQSRSWLAYRDGEAVAYLSIQPGNPSAAYIINDEGTASIKGAFTKPAARGKGIGAALLNNAIEWARSAGYKRCSVDFEPQNIPGGSFWLKHFRPVCYSVIRHIDERVATIERSESVEGEFFA